MNSDHKIDLLLVDDKPENLISLEAVLESPEINIVKANSGNEALSLLFEYDFALIMLDVQMPEMDGFETAELIRSNAFSKHIPIMFVTAINKEQKHVFKGYDSGAVDYLFKPLNPQVIQQKTSVFIDLFRQKKNLEKITEDLRDTVNRLEESQKIIEKQNLQLSYYSIHDSLTGLHNRRYMDEIIEKEFARSRRYNTDMACLLMDLDFFKQVNDTCGHQFGDYVLKELSVSLKGHVRETDYTFRYGGEEFMVLLPNTDIEGALETAEKFRQLCEDRIYDNNENISMLTISIGVSSLVYNNPVSSIELISLADNALFQAKAEGRNRVRVYEMPEQKTGGKEGITQGIRPIKEKLMFILEKTKRASIASLELLIRESGYIGYRKRSERTTLYIQEMSKELRMPASIISTFNRSTSLYSCFKFLMDQSLMLKDPISDSDKLNIKRMPYMINEMAASFDFFQNERAVLLYHLENYDGSGYPEGLKGDQIPLGARIFSVADAFTAMTSDRDYKPTLSHDQAILELADHAGSQFDPEIVKLFLQVLESHDRDSVTDETLKKAHLILSKKKS